MNDIADILKPSPVDLRELTDALREQAELEEHVARNIAELDRIRLLCMTEESQLRQRIGVLKMRIEELREEALEIDEEIRRRRGQEDGE